MRYGSEKTGAVPASLPWVSEVFGEGWVFDASPPAGLEGGGSMEGLVVDDVFEVTTESGRGGNIASPPADVSTVMVLAGCTPCFRV